MTPPTERESDQALGGEAGALVAREDVAGPVYLPQLLLPLSQPVACVVCGNIFDVRRRRGRPEQFCGDHCRDAQYRRQKADWSKKR